MRRAPCLAPQCDTAVGHRKTRLTKLRDSGRVLGDRAIAGREWLLPGKLWACAAARQASALPTASTPGSRPSKINKIAGNKYQMLMLGGPTEAFP